MNGVAGSVTTATVDFTPTPFTETGVTLNADGTVTVAAGTPAGTYTTTYTICDKVNTDNCDTATVTIRVTAPVIDMEAM